MIGRFLNKKILTLFAVAILGFGTYAFADWGMGYGPPGWMHREAGRHRGGYGGPGCGDWGDLSEEQLKKLDEERNTFFEATKDLRQDIYQKRLELKSELAKKNPDAKRAADLQKEISDLKAQFAQKRLDQFFKMREIDSDLGWRFMGPNMMGPHMMGYGMGAGMMGPGMMGFGRGMGPGMMGPAWSRGIDSGGSGKDYPQQYGQLKSPLEEKDALTIVEDYIKSTRNPNLKTGKIEDAGDTFKVEIVTKDNSLVDTVIVDKSSGGMRSAD